MVTRVQRLPYGIGRFTAGWYLLIGVLLAIVAWGLFAYIHQLAEGLSVTGLRDIGTMGGSPWGLYIAFDIYFVGVSFAGITVAALIRLFNLERLRPVSRIAELLTVVSLILAAFSVIPDLGQPMRGIVHLFLYARPQSPFFGTFTLVMSGYLFASLVYLYLAGRRDAAICAERSTGALQKFYRFWAAGYRDTPAERERHQRASLWLAIAIIPLLVTAHSTLGFVFGLLVGRPGWFSALQAPAFVILAGVSGVGLLIVIAAILRWVLGEREQLNVDVFKWLGSFLMVLTITYLYLLVVEGLTATYAAHHHELRVSTALLTGESACLFWGGWGAMVIAIAVLVLPYLPTPRRVWLWTFQPIYARATGAAALVVAVLMLVQASPVTRQAGLTMPLTFRGMLPWLLAILLVLFAVSFLPALRGNVIAGAVLSGVLVNLAAIGKRVLLVVASETHGTLLPYGIGSYSPTWVEYSIIVGLFALGTLLYALFMKVFPIMEVQQSAEGGY